MNNSFGLIILSVTASVFLGAVSNWVYDLFRAKGILPNQLTLRAMLVVGLASVPLIFLVAYPEISNRELLIIRELFSSNFNVSLSKLIVLMGVSFLLGYLISVNNIRKLRNLYSQKENRLIEVQQRLEEAERRLDQSLSKNQGGFSGKVIKPK